MTVPAMPGAGLIVVKPEFALGGLEAVLHRPAMAFHRNQRLNRGTSRAPGGEVGALAIADRAPDQQAAGPQPALLAAVFANIKIGQFEIRPVIQPRPLGAIASRQPLPSRWRKSLGNRFGGSADPWLADPGMELVI